MNSSAHVAAEAPPPRGSRSAARRGAGKKRRVETVVDTAKRRSRKQPVKNNRSPVENNFLRKLPPNLKNKVLDRFLTHKLGFKLLKDVIANGGIKYRLFAKQPIFFLEKVTAVMNRGIRYVHMHGITLPLTIEDAFRQVIKEYIAAVFWLVKRPLDKEFYYRYEVRFVYFFCKRLFKLLKLEANKLEKITTNSLVSGMREDSVWRASSFTDLKHQMRSNHFARIVPWGEGRGNAADRDSIDFVLINLTTLAYDLAIYLNNKKHRKFETLRYKQWAFLVMDQLEDNFKEVEGNNNNNLYTVFRNFFYTG